MRPNHILMLSWEYPPRLVGGIARHVSELSRALARAGVKVDVVTAPHPGAPAQEVMQEESADSVASQMRVLRATPFPIRPLDFISEIQQLNFGLLEGIVKDLLLESQPPKYDIIHAHDWLVAFAARTLKHSLSIPLVATIHATEAGRNQGIHTPMQSYIHSVEWMLTYDAWRVICCSEAMSAEIRGGLKVPGDKLHIIPNGIAPDRMRCYDSPAQLSVFRQRWAEPWERIILFVGRLVREKGLEVLIDAMPEVLAAHPEAKLIIAGGGWYGHFSERAASLGLAHKVRFTEFLPEEDLPRLYTIAEVAAFPSLYEPFGIVALEAMAAGVPVVTSDIGGFREIVRHGQTGLHTWANNPHSLAWGINQVLSDSALASLFKKRARQEILRRFNWDKIAERTLDIYSQVMEFRAEAALPRELAFGGPGVRPRYLAAEAVSSRS